MVEQERSQTMNITTYTMTTDESRAGKKDDSGKLMYNLIPVSAIEGLAQVLTMGAKKYTPNGWKTVPDATERYYSALFRHLLAWRNGEEIDPESGLHHLKHVLTNVAFLLELDNDSIKPECTVANVLANAGNMVFGNEVREQAKHNGCPNYQDCIQTNGKFADYCICSKKLTP